MRGVAGFVGVGVAALVFCTAACSGPSGGGSSSGDPASSSSSSTSTSASSSGSSAAGSQGSGVSSSRGNSSNAGSGATSRASSTTMMGSSSRPASSAGNPSSGMGASSTAPPSSGASPVCGNGSTESGETCDDGNTATEACTYGLTSCMVCNGSCQLVAGATSYCGDGTTNGNETCDDGNAVAEPCPYGQRSCMVCGTTCTMTPGATSFCGDGTPNGPETCDDGNETTEVCTYGLTSCTVCNATCANQAGAVSYCGDAVVNGPETCDDANTVQDDGCHNNCVEDRDFACTGNPSVCATSYVDFTNLTSFGFNSVVVDNEEWTTCGDVLGLPAGAYTAPAGVLTLGIKPNRAHTIVLRNGTVNANPCARNTYEEWTINQPALPPNGSAAYNLTNGRSLPQAVMNNTGQSFQCFWLAYNDGAVTRLARYRFNADGTFVFKEHRNVDNVLLRQATGSYVETGRTVGNDFTMQLRFSAVGFWNANYNAFGQMFIQNTVNTSGVVQQVYSGHGRDPGQCPP